MLVIARYDTRRGNTAWRPAEPSEPVNSIHESMERAATCPGEALGVHGVPDKCGQPPRANRSLCEASTHTTDEEDEQCMRSIDRYFRACIKCVANRRNPLDRDVNACHQHPSTVDHRPGATRETDVVKRGNEAEGNEPAAKPYTKELSGNPGAIPRI